MEWKLVLQSSALILGLVNGLMLLRHYLRDRPKLALSAIHPDSYQWFFVLPDGKYQNQPTRKYGFLSYVSIINRGIRDVSLESWSLHIKTVGGKWVELHPLSIPEPQIELGQSGSLKVWPVLGQKGVYHKENAMIRAGSGISGFAYYIAEHYGGNTWNPMIKEGKATGRIVVRSVLGNKASAKVPFTKIPLKKAKEIVEGIDKVDLSGSAPSNAG